MPKFINRCVSNKMELLWLMTPQHSGTHFLRHLLESHSQISFWIQSDHPVEDNILEYQMGKYWNKNLTKEEFQELVFRLIPDNVYSAEVFARMKIEMPVKSNLKYKLFHSHGKEVNLSLKHDFKRISTVRDPLLSIISALRRTNDGEASADNIISTLKSVFQFQSYKFCTDLLDAQSALKVFDFLELEVELSCRRYVAIWPIINKTTTEIENYQADLTRPKISEDFLMLLRNAKNMLTQGYLHPLMNPWVRKLRAAKLQDDFIKIGYKNLLWFE